MMNLLLEQQTKFVKHYEKLVSDYESGDEILDEGLEFVKEKITTFATNGRSKYVLKVEPKVGNIPISSYRPPNVQRYHPFSRRFALSSYRNWSLESKTKT